MSSYIVKPQEASPPSQPENVKTVGHEVYQNNTPFSDQDGSVLAGTWTTVHGDRTTRLKNRLKVLAAHSELKLTSSPLSGWNGSVPPSTEQRFLSEIAIPQDTDLRSQPNLNVKTVDQEDKQNNVGTWTEVTDDRTTRANRKKVLDAQSEVKFSPSPSPGQKGSSPSSPELQKRPTFKAKVSTRIANGKKSQQEIASLKEQSNSLQAQVVTLSSTLDSLMTFLKGFSSGASHQSQLEGSPLPKFEVETPKASFKDVLVRSPSSIKSSSSSAASSPSVGSAASSSCKGSPVAKPHPIQPLSTPARAIPATAEKGSATPLPSSPALAAGKRCTPTPSPSRSDRDNSAASSPRENPTASNSAASHDHGGSAAISRHGGSATSYPKSDGSFVVEFAIPVVCFSKAIPAVTAKKVISHPSPPLTAPPSRDDLGNKTRKFTQSISTSVRVTATDEKVLSKETTSMPKVAESYFSPRPASPRVLTDRSGVQNDSRVVTGVYGPPDGVDGNCGVTKGSGSVPKNSGGVPVDSDGAPGGPGQVPEIPPMPADGSNRASEGEQLWSPDPPTPSAGEVFSTIPATRTATDNQLLKFANLQVVWYTSAITTILITFDYLQRLQRDMVVSFQQISMEVLRSMDCSISSHRTSGYTSQNAAA